LPLAQGADAIAAAGEDLVRVALVTDIEDQPVIRRVEDIVDGSGQLDNAEACTQVAAGFRHGRDCLGTQLVSELAQVLFGESAKVRRDFHPVQKRRLGG